MERKLRAQRDHTALIQKQRPWKRARQGGKGLLSWSQQSLSPMEKRLLARFSIQLRGFMLCHFSLRLIVFPSTVTKESYFCSYKSLENPPLPHLCPQSVAIKPLGKGSLLQSSLLTNKQTLSQRYVEKKLGRNSLGQSRKKCLSLGLKLEQEM